MAADLKDDLDSKEAQLKDALREAIVDSRRQDVSVRSISRLEIG